MALNALSVRAVSLVLAIFIEALAPSFAADSLGKAEDSDGSSRPAPQRRAESSSARAPRSNSSFPLRVLMLLRALRANTKER